jgi:hypothetical protein
MPAGEGSVVTCGYHYIGLDDLFSIKLRDPILVLHLLFLPLLKKGEKRRKKVIGSLGLSRRHPEQ